MIGKDEAGGVTRLSYSIPYRNGQALIRQYMEQAGMAVKLDSTGNLIGEYCGINPELPAVLTGSHLDTVPQGGAFDGALGIIAAIECVDSWNQSKWQPQRTVKVIATIEEEGTLFGLACFGSRVLAGEFSDDQLSQLTNQTGCSLSELMARLGSQQPGKTNPGGFDPIHCFLELHVEQGDCLNLTGLPLGVVTAIVGIDRTEITIRGEANHAGTTRMARRKDALAAAAHLITLIHTAELTAGDNYVATVGKLAASPNAVNVIAGEVKLSVEIRAEDSQIIAAARSDIQRFLRHCEQQYGVSAEVTMHNQTPPIRLNQRLIEMLADAANQLAVPCAKMPSWAGHDAMIFAKLAPAAMLFVPSLAGISHSPAENSDWHAIDKATQVLNHTLKRLATES
jgi:allantoate deiminase/N-carbamoyl-L-amino-acid hydrolase